MAGLVPAIHHHGWLSRKWIAGTSPAMTVVFDLFGNFVLNSPIKHSHGDVLSAGYSIHISHRPACPGDPFFSERKLGCPDKSGNDGVFNAGSPRSIPLAVRSVL
jgi:hypothetical protein